METIRQLHSQGRKCAIVSGDAREITEEIGNRLGVDAAYGSCMPEDKVAVLKKLKEKGGICGVHCENSGVINALIEEKKAASGLLEEEISSIGVKIEELKAEKKEKSASLKDLAKEIAKLEEKKAKEEEAKAEEQRKADLENVLSNLLSSGMSVEAILEKLK